jgi:pimeloyl-ACP methyl ester carboxylesterase
VSSAVSSQDARRSRPVLRSIAGLAVLAVGAGAVFETLAARGDSVHYPAPGRLVKVADHGLHLNCLGSGGPTVVFEAGLGESSPTWSLVQPEVAANTRVCAYDRAGYGWSEPGQNPKSPVRQAEELRDLLAAAGEQGPYVLVAHSLGANITRLFVDRYPEQVAGAVLVDPTDVDAVVQAGRPVLPIAQFRLTSLLARVGLVRLFGRSLVPWMVGTDPPSAVVEAAPVLYSPRSLSTAADELAVSVEGARAVAQVTAPGAWGSLALVVITAGVGGAGHGEDLAALSSAGVHRVADASGHYVQYERPEIVIEAIRDVVDDARAE